MEGSASSVALLWIPLGAGSRVPVVRWNGRAYESLLARREHRRPRPLFHATLEIELRGDPYVVEMTPAWGAAHSTVGAVASGPVGARALGRSRFFRYEVHCWRGGVIPDRAYAVGGAQTLSRDEETARRILDAAPLVPTRVWGRDELGVGDMWNSNSLVSWLLVRAGIQADELHPPDGGRAPGWSAGLTAAAS